MRKAPEPAADRPSCPECKGALQKRGPGRKENSVRYFCPACEKWCTVTPSDQMPDGHRLKGVSTLVDANGKTVLQWIKTREDRIAREEAIALALERLPERVPTFKTKVRAPAVTDADLCAVYPVGDPHIGMLAWGPEAGEDHDLKIAEADLCAAFDLLVTETPSTELAIVAFLGDNVHADNLAGVTNRSNAKLDTDSRYEKVLDVALRTAIYSITAALARHRIVVAYFLQGNHDDITALFLRKGIGAYFRNEPRVLIDQTPGRFQYREFGKNLFGFYHGHDVKQDKLPAVMATDQAAAWGRTEHRKWFIGHFHSTQVYEHPGVTCEIFRTLAGKDSYHAENGYRSQRTLTRIVYHREDGELIRSTADIGRIRRWAAGKAA